MLRDVAEKNRKTIIDAAVKQKMSVETQINR